MFNLAYFFPLSFWHIIIIFSFLKNQKPNIRAFRSKGAICPHIPSFILCFLFYISRLDIYNPSLLYMFAVSTMNLLPCLFLRCQAPIEQLKSFCNDKKLFKPARPWPTDQ